jgi:hypothetical protein
MHVAREQLYSAGRFKLVATNLKLALLKLGPRQQLCGGEQTPSDDHARLAVV